MIKGGLETSQLSGEGPLVVGRWNNMFRCNFSNKAKGKSQLITI